MSEGYGTTGAGRGRPAGGTGTASAHEGVPFRGHTIRVSEFRREHEYCKHHGYPEYCEDSDMAPDGWTRHA